MTPETHTLTTEQVANMAHYYRDFPLPVGYIFGGVDARYTWVVWNGEKWLRWYSDEAVALMAKLADEHK